MGMRRKSPKSNTLKRVETVRRIKEYVESGRNSLRELARRHGVAFDESTFKINGARGFINGGPELFQIVVTTDVESHRSVLERAQLMLNGGTLREVFNAHWRDIEGKAAAAIQAIGAFPCDWPTPPTAAIDW